MLKLLFKTTAYYIIWQKFKKQILLVLCSIILIGLIGVIYEDLFKVLKVTNKESVGALLFIKWLLILIIIGVNIFVLRKTKIEYKDFKTENKNTDNYSNYSQKEQGVLKKKEILTTTDLILKKYAK